MVMNAILTSATRCSLLAKLGLRLRSWAICISRARGGFRPVDRRAEGLADFGSGFGPHVCVNRVEFCAVARAGERAGPHVSAGRRAAAGALGFALNFVSLGTVGGDLFKAVLLAKVSPGRRTEAVVTVMADRILGLLMMMLLASTAILFADWRGAARKWRCCVA